MMCILSCDLSHDTISLFCLQLDWSVYSFIFCLLGEPLSIPRKLCHHSNEGIREIRSGRQVSVHLHVASRNYSTPFYLFPSAPLPPHHSPPPLIVSFRIRKWLCSVQCPAFVTNHPRLGDGSRLVSGYHENGMMSPQHFLPPVFHTWLQSWTQSPSE